MNKTPYLIILAVLILAGSIMACNLNSQISTETPMPTDTSTETSTPAATPTEPAPLASATPEFAPFCEPEVATILPPAGCPVSIAEESSTYCSDKNPYNLILLNPGSKYELITKGFRCSSAGTKDDKEMIACTGPMASFFEINVCDPACVIPTVQADVTQCPQDYSYSTLQGCCTKELQQVGGSCKTLKFRTTSCVINCGEFKTDGKCKKNSFACEWDGDAGVCKQRK